MLTATWYRLPVCGLSVSLPGSRVKVWQVRTRLQRLEKEDLHRVASKARDNKAGGYVLERNPVRLHTLRHEPYPTLVCTG